MNGIDISNHQAGLNIASVPCDFVILKATEGTTFVDKYCDGFYQKAKSLGKKLGVYHFATGSSSGQAEADFFLKNVQGYIGEAILVLDWEAKAVRKGVGYAKAFLDRVHERTGVKPLIYMSNSVIHEYNWSSVVSADYGLWNAGYYAGYQTMGYNPNAPLIGGTSPWSGAAIYQYTSSGRLSGWGGNLDLNVAYMDASAWDKYAGGKSGSISPAPAPTPAPQTAGSIAELQNECNVQGFSAQKVDNIAGPITLAGCPMLRTGAQGNITRWVQKKLNALGYNCGQADGIFGTKTKSGIMAYQKSMGLIADGVVGPKTWSKLLHLS